MSDYGPPLPYPLPHPPPPAGVYATWVDRVVATLWDVVHLWPAYLMIFGGVVVLTVGIVMVSGDAGAAGTLLIVLGALLVLAGYAWAIVRYVLNYIVDQGRTGYTWGKRKVGIRVVHEVTGQAPGIGSCVGRYFLHAIINYVFLLDYLWPLWDARTQTLTDKVLTTVVVRQRPS